MATQIPHRFVRNMNVMKQYEKRLGNRHNPLENTLTLLQDPQTNRQLFLIGTMNSSTFLANRTKELIEEVKPDALFVQTNEKWYDQAKGLKIDSQTEFGQLRRHFTKCWSSHVEQDGLLKPIYQAKLYIFLSLLENTFTFGSEDWAPYEPGLEMKYAIDQQLKHNTNVYYGGHQLDYQTIHALRTETELNPFSLLYNQFKTFNNTRHYAAEFYDYNKLLSEGGETFSEGIDKYRANWFSILLEKLCPLQKRIIIDERDVNMHMSLFRDMKEHKTTVAVVNQWHVDGITRHWQAATNTVPRQDFINPVGDMDISGLQEEYLVNHVLRAFVSKLSNSEPVTWWDYKTQYHKDHMESERVRNIHFDGAADQKHMMENMPYNKNYDSLLDGLELEKKNPKSDFPVPF